MVVENISAIRSVGMREDHLARTCERRDRGRAVHRILDNGRDGQSPKGLHANILAWVTGGVRGVINIQLFEGRVIGPLETLLSRKNRRRTIHNKAHSCTGVRISKVSTRRIRLRLFVLASVPYQRDDLYILRCRERVPRSLLLPQVLRVDAYACLDASLA